MPDQYDTLSAQWHSAASSSNSELLHASSGAGFYTATFRGRLSRATNLQHSSIHDHVTFCLNEEGTGQILTKPERNFRAANLLFLHHPSGTTTSLQRYTGNHRFTLLSFATSYLRNLLQANTETLTPPIAASLTSDSPLAFTEPMSNATKAFAQALTSPPIVAAASQLWFQSKAVEFIATHCYEQPDAEAKTFFCSQQKRIAGDRIEKAKAYLLANLDEPLKLDAVARAAGTSPHYLSRTFSNETGRTLSRYLRHLRVERATELLAEGRLNISETAIEVGYKSQSHFARAFEIEKGCTPSQFIVSLKSDSK